jgi:ectoine hydroxylase-related dioxygenase (phytanoyl-CoA dioxygenase family)
MREIAQGEPRPERLQEIHRSGFTIARGVIGAREIELLKHDLERAIAQDLAEAAAPQGAFMVLNLMTRGASFVRLLENPVLHAHLTPILGDTCIVYAYTSSSLPPGGTNYSNRIHVDCPRFIENYVTNVGITLALDDFTDENGATYLLPGSHRNPATPSRETFDAGAVRAYPRAGDAIVFNARTWHRGGDNRTATARHAVTMNVCRSYMRQQFDFPRLVDAEVVANLGSLGRRFLGFDVRMPASLDEYYLPEDRRLYKANQG